MGCLIKNELYKTIRLKKMYLVMLAALAIEIAAALQGKFGGVPPGMQKINGENFPLLLFDNLPYLFVIFATVFIADSWVDEYRSGAMKLPMLRPVNRIAFLNAKVVSYIVFAGALTGFTVLTAYAVGTIAFGWGENTRIEDIFLIAKAGVATMLPVLGFGLLVLFIAIITDNMAVTVGCAMGLLLVSQVLEVSDGLRDYSIIYMMRALFKNIFIQFDRAKAIINIAVTAAYIVIFYTGSVLLFRKKDLLV